MTIRSLPAPLRRPFLTRRLVIGAAIAALAFSAPLIASDGSTDDPIAAIVAAERSFAADAVRIGVNPAFRAHAAPDSILLRPDPRPALEQLAREVDQVPLQLEWQPALAAVSRSNDLGFATGPYRLTREGKAMHGQYLTIWQRGADGRWRWYLDHGLPPVAEQQPTVFPGAVRDLGIGAVAAEDGGRLADAEDALNRAITAGQWMKLVDALADQASVLRPRLGVLSKAEAIKLLPGRPGFAVAERLGMRIAGAGDLAATYGRLSRDAAQPGVNYVRIWRRESGGWRLLVDEIS
jgi:ketosteroid isomerase-like protein